MTGDPEVREEAPFVADEREMLRAWLDYHRATLLKKCQGLSPDQLATRSVPPSSMSLLGLVRHMADVEQNWFERVFSGIRAKPHYWQKEHTDDDFDGAAADNATEGLATFRSECARSQTIERESGSLDDRDAGGGISLRWIMVHMIEEYARHNGHADLLRECIDGAVGS